MRLINGVPFEIGGQLLKLSHSVKYPPSSLWGEMTSKFLDLFVFSELSAIRDPISDPSPVHQHINQPISISLMRGWEGSALRPLLVTLGFRMDREGEAGTETGCSWIMDDFSRAFNTGCPVYIATENLPDKRPSRRKTAPPGEEFRGAHGQVLWFWRHI